MAHVSPDILEMPTDAGPGTMPWYPHIGDWVRAEIAGLTDEQLDFDDQAPDREWMWWSIRRQVSHIAWDALVFPSRRCADLLWPGEDTPDPIGWEEHRLGPDNRWDRELSRDRFWELDDILPMVDLGMSWLERVVTEQPIETLRATTKSVWGSYFWEYVITTLPRGAGPDPDVPGNLAYTLEGSLWMVFYEALSHVRSIQRLKLHQGLDLAVELPRVGYLRLPEYWGDTNANGPSMDALPRTTEYT